MLEAADANLAFIISLKRSILIFRYPTSRQADYPIFLCRNLGVGDDQSAVIRNFGRYPSVQRS
jgi:hypothetical protein